MKEYNHFIRLEITICPGHSIHTAYLGYIDNKLGIKTGKDISYEQGMKILRKLEKRLGKVATMTINSFDPSISYKEIYGFLD